MEWQNLVLWGVTGAALGVGVAAVAAAHRAITFVRLMAWAAKESRHELFNQVAQLRAQLAAHVADDGRESSAGGSYPPIIVEPPRSRSPLPPAVEQWLDAGGNLPALLAGDLAELPAGEGYKQSAATLEKGGARE